MPGNYRVCAERGKMGKEETEVGIVTNYYSKIDVAAITLTGNVQVGDTIVIRGHTTNLEQTINGMEIEHQSVQEAKAGDQIGIKISGRIRRKDKVYKK